MLKSIKAKVLFSLFFVANFAFAQVSESNEIQKVLLEQQNNWNKGDVEQFMQGYWNSDSLVFIGKKGLTHGWNNTLNNYKKSYPDAKTMGKLFFTILKTEITSAETAFVIGKWELERENPVSGHFLLQFKKINGSWKIVADHTS
ncbi:MAG: nuclear transport factor 2 family protein [Bacteroidota bacterium]